MRTNDANTRKPGKKMKDSRREDSRPNEAGSYERTNALATNKYGVRPLALEDSSWIRSLSIDDFSSGTTPKSGELFRMSCKWQVKNPNYLCAPERERDGESVSLERVERSAE
jgi:hypothetical protein